MNLLNLFPFKADSHFTAVLLVIVNSLIFAAYTAAVAGVIKVMFA